MNAPIQQFNPTQIAIIDHNGSKWLAAEQLGLALGFSEKRARDGVNNLYNRHIDEFSEQDSVTIKLMATDGKAYNTRIFSHTGCNLLSFFANTPNAKQFRKWAARVLAGEIQPQSSQLADLAAQNSMLKAALLKHHPEYRAIKVMYDGGLESWQIGMAVGLSRHSIRRKVTEMRKLGLLAQVKPRSLPAPAQQSLALEG